MSDATGTQPLLLTPEMRVEPEGDAARAQRRAERLAELQAIVGTMPPLLDDAETAAPALSGQAAEAIRDELARLVRAELEGPLGERITHNLRRLIRQEIAHALAHRDLLVRDD